MDRNQQIKEELESFMRENSPKGGVISEENFELKRHDPEFANIDYSKIDDQKIQKNLPSNFEFSRGVKKFTLIKYLEPQKYKGCYIEKSFKHTGGNFILFSEENFEEWDIYYAIKNEPKGKGSVEFAFWEKLAKNEPLTKKDLESIFKTIY